MSSSGDGRSRRAQNVQRFQVSLGGVLKIENIFLEVIKISDFPEDNINDRVQEEWSKIDRDSISLVIGEHDFSDLKHFEKLMPLEPPNIQTAFPFSGPPPAPAAPSDDVPPPPPPAPIGSAGEEGPSVHDNQIRYLGNGNIWTT